MLRTCHCLPVAVPQPRPRLRLAATDAAGEQAVRQIIDRYLGGLSLRQAGAPFGVGRGAVAAILDRHGIARRRAGRPRQAVPAEAHLLAGDDDRFLPVQEVADVLALSKRTTYRLISSGELEAVRVSSRSLRVRQSALRAYLLSRQFAPGAAGRLVAPPGSPNAAPRPGD
jgi:excisionase family DNA binding protein